MVLRRSLDGQICWLLAFEDAVHVAGRATVLVGEVGTIRDKATCGGEKAFDIDGRKLMARGERNDQVTMDYRGWACGQN
jgi:hypothetical protein